MGLLEGFSGGAGALPSACARVVCMFEGGRLAACYTVTCQTGHGRLELGQHCAPLGTDRGFTGESCCADFAFSSFLHNPRPPDVVDVETRIGGVKTATGRSTAREST